MVGSRGQAEQKRVDAPETQAREAGGPIANGRRCAGVRTPSLVREARTQFSSTDDVRRSRWPVDVGWNSARCLFARDL
jgi:hypothetical protein